jgi:hypothetical protein
MFRHEGLCGKNRKRARKNIKEAMCGRDSEISSVFLALWEAVDIPYSWIARTDHIKRGPNVALAWKSGILGIAPSQCGRTGTGDQAQRLLHD